MTRTHKQIGLFSLLVAADQLSKWWIQQPDFHAFTVIDGFFNIIRAYNPGVAFSMFADLPDAVRIWLLLGVTIGIAVLVVAGALAHRHHFLVAGADSHRRCRQYLGSDSTGLCGRFYRLVCAH